MSLNNLAKSALFVAAFATAVPNVGCSKTQEAASGETTPVATAPNADKNPPFFERELEFPECGKGMKGTRIGESGGYVSFPPGSTEENLKCVGDRLNNRDCRAIREEGRERIERILSFFKCKNGKAKLMARPSQIAGLTDFSSSTTRTKGDCNETAAEYSNRIRRVLDRLACDKDGKPYEKLGWGEAEGGRVYNPCAGGNC